MPDSESVRALTCPSCGAQIHVGEGQSRTTCEYCGALLELPHPSQPEARITIVVPPRGSPVKTPQVVKRRLRPRGITAMVAALIVLGIAGGLALIVYQAVRRVDFSGLASTLSSLRASTPAMLFPANDGQAIDSLVYTYNGANDSSFLTYLDGETHTARWHSPPLGEDSYNVAMAGNDELIFVAVKTEIMALDRRSGQVSWQASISDELPTGCASGCLRVVGQRVVALAKDGELYGLDARTGRTVWDQRLTSTPDRLYAIGDEVAVFDRPRESTVLSMIDAATGTMLRRLSPQCRGDSSGMTDDPDLSSPVLVAPDQKSLVMLFGFFNACVQRWDVTTGTLMWNASLGDVSFSFSFSAEPALLGKTIYVATDNQLQSIQMADGTWTTQLDDPDYEFVPLAEQDGTLIVRAKRTRGTTRFELWGVDETSGSRIWQHPIPGGEPMDEPNRMAGLVDQGDLAWTAHLTPDGLVVVQATAQPNQLTVETLNPKTGASSGVQRLRLSGISGDFYSVPEVLGWPGEQLWLMVDGKMFVVNLRQARMEFAWP
jgi:outer membrane protein assembly factor BamB